MHPSTLPHPSARHHTTGFSLIELMIATAVVVILAAVAVPSFLGSLQKSRRSEAFAALSQVQLAQERWRSNNATFNTTSTTALGVPSNTPSGYYTITLGSSTESGDADATSYVATAEGVSGTSQANDTACRKLSVRMRNGNVQYAGCGSCTTFTYAAVDRCWAR